MILKGKFGSGSAEGEVWFAPKQKLALERISKSALKKAILELSKVLKSEQKRLGKKGEFLNFPLAMLQDPNLLHDMEENFDQAFQKWEQKFRRLDDLYLRLRAQDIVDLRQRLAVMLGGKKSTGVPKVPFIAMMEDLYVTDLLEWRKFPITGIALGKGNESAHGVMMAKALGIPVIGGIAGLLKKAKERQAAKIQERTLYLGEKPSRPSLRALTFPQKSISSRSLSFPRRRESITVADGTQVALRANVQVPEEIEAAKQAAAAGIGLFRTEFIWMTGTLSLAEEIKIYKKAMDAFSPLPVVFRLADFGSDKPYPRAVWPPETNPALGWRGLAFLLDSPKILNRQLQALFEAAGKRELSILLPMVRTLEEIKQFLKILTPYRKKFSAAVRLGIMVETPSAAAMIQGLPKEVSFISLGTNDLLQYFFAIDRLHPTIKANPFNPLFLDVLKQILETAQRAGKSVSICGELAGDPKALPLLLSLGLREFSVSIPKISELRRVLSRQ